MIIPIKKIVKPLDLGEYAEEYRGGVAYVWVNPPRDTLTKFQTLREESEQAQQAANALKAQMDTDTPPTLNEIESVAQELRRIAGEFFAHWSEIFSQHDDGPEQDTYISPEGMAEIYARETDPGLYPWLCQRADELMTAHREIGKKKSVKR